MADKHVAIISGGLGDIGRAIAMQLAGLGADVALGDIRESSDADEVLDAIRGKDRRARYDRVDVSDAAAVQAWLRAVEEDLGMPDWIVPNAAVVALQDLDTVTPEAWEREVGINLHGMFYLAQAAALRLRESKRPGRIVFLGSWAGHAPHTHIPTYCVAKAGVRMLAKCMALELAASDILVNEVAPGYVDAGLSGRIFEDKPAAREKCLAQTPVGRLIEPEDVAHQVAHLCDPANRHMTGAVILMDGGLSLTSAATVQKS